MTREETLNELKKVFAPYTANKEMLAGINDETDLIRDLKINSANLVDIIIDAEAKYDIEIDYDSADKMTNVGTCIDVITEKTRPEKMTSTGNDIVALNAIDIARTNTPVFYSKIISPPEKDIYDQQFLGKLPFENFVWLLWSIKESAYKYAQRLTPDLVFSPTRTVISKLISPLSNSTMGLEGAGFNRDQVYQGTVLISGQTLCSRSLISDEFIFSVVNNQDNFDDTYWGIQQINSSEPEYQSKAVREILKGRLGHLLPGGKWQIEKTPYGYPVLLNNGFEMEIPVSLAHHEGWVGYSLQLKTVT